MKGDINFDMKITDEDLLLVIGEVVLDVEVYLNDEELEAANINNDKYPNGSDMVDLKDINAMIRHINGEEIIAEVI